MRPSLLSLRLRGFQCALPYCLRPCGPFPTPSGRLVSGMTPLSCVDVLWAAIISWDHPDSVIRLRNRTDMPAVNLMHWDAHEQVSTGYSWVDTTIHLIPYHNRMVFDTRYSILALKV